MSFNSRPFLFLFLPITFSLLVLFQHGRRWNWAKAWLLGASLLFYAYGDLSHLWLFMTTSVVNYFVGRQLQRTSAHLHASPRMFFWILGLAWNLGILGYVKYGVFLVTLLNQSFGSSLSIHPMALPLGISFYTFTQLMYLIDCHAGLVDKPYRWIDYFLFATLFPYTLAGPLVKHEEILPQIERGPTLAPFSDMVFGITLFVLGLFKKVVLADGLAALANPVFGAAQHGISIPVLSAWVGALSFTMQLYFDFSGYSDMAVGLGRLFHIHLPYNFNSPYKAVNAVDFWKRWHMTLTRFLTNYIYNPLVLRWTRERLLQGKSTLKKGDADLPAFTALLAAPTLITMLVAGLWHGAGWTYICFGILHGFYLVINHASRVLRQHGYLPAFSLPTWTSCLITFVAVMVSFVFFRAADVRSAGELLSAMIGRNHQSFFPDASLRSAVWALLGLLGAVWFLPNSQEICTLALSKSPENASPS
jgi:alginate O-acetyltransferase complex protein AlgI